MNSDELLAVYPALYSHKGTPARIRIVLETGGNLLIEPLRYNAGGLILKTVGGTPLLPNIAKDVPLPSLLGHDGRVLKELKHSVPEDCVVSIEAFVIYPNGATWEGHIFEGRENDLSMLIWSWDLSRRLCLSEENKENLFGAKLAWPDVPTTVGIVADNSLGQCTFIEHSCPDCDARTKFF